MQERPQDLTAEQYKALKKRSGGYWGIQFGASAFFMVVFAAGVVATWGYGIAFTDPDAAAGDGFMSLLSFALFLGCFLFLLKIRRQSTGLGQLRFAWVIGQTEHSATGNFRSASRDAVALGLAQKAARGQLSDEEVAMLQGLDPEFPYPWRIPPSELAAKS